jgi:hypothetical protein
VHAIVVIDLLKVFLLILTFGCVAQKWPYTKMKATKKEERLRTLTEVKDALYQDYVQSGDNRRYISHCQFRLSLSLAQASQPLLYAIICKWHILLSPGKGRIERPLPSPVWHFHPHREVPGVVRTCRMVCLLPLLKTPGDALKSC